MTATDHRLAGFLADVPVLSSLPPAARERLAGRSQTVRVSAGDWLFREGEEADCAYVVRTGRLDVVAEGRGDEVLLTVRRGGVLGELALLRAERRAASVRARRDAELIELRRATFEELLEDEPGFALALTRSLADQLARSRAPAATDAVPVTIGVLALDGGAAAAVAERLAEGLRRAGSLAQFGPSDAATEELPRTLAHAEREHDRVLMVGGEEGGADPWTDFVAREADLVVAVGSRLPPRSRFGPLRGCELMLSGPARDYDALTELAPRNVSAALSGDALLESADMLARRLTGRAPGLVLSGGGARAFAHLGVLEELSDAGIRFDQVSGVSLGSVVAGAVAMGIDPPTIYDRFTQEFVHRNPSNDYTVPAIAVLRGRKVRRTLEEVFGDTRIEELRTRFSCLSCDLVGRRAVVHSTGLLREAIYASLAIPGVFPPVVPGPGRLLVDGGVLNNLPVERMARAREGPVVASDVTARDGRWADARRTGRYWLAGPMRRLLTGDDVPVPRLAETLFRTFTLGSSDTALAASSHADLVVLPEVDGIGLMDWKALPRVREAGRAATRAALAAAPGFVEQWGGRPESPMSGAKQDIPRFGAGPD